MYGPGRARVRVCAELNLSSSMSSSVSSMLCRTLRVLQRSLLATNARRTDGRPQLSQTASTSSYTATSTVNATSCPTVFFSFQTLLSQTMNICDRTLPNHIHSQTGTQPLAVVTTATAPPTFISNDVTTLIGRDCPNRIPTTTVMETSSVLKKRRRKMNQHKYKKWRKKYRFLRRRLGK